MANTDSPICPYCGSKAMTRYGRSPLEVVCSDCGTMVDLLPYDRAPSYEPPMIRCCVCQQEVDCVDGLGCCSAECGKDQEQS
jgi:hypothetical protein